MENFWSIKVFKITWFARKVATNKNELSTELNEQNEDDVVTLVN